MHPKPEIAGTWTSTRRGLFDRVAAGFGATALLGLLQDDRLLAATSPDVTSLQTPLARPRANSVIHLFMNGGPSQMDLFDPKPALDKFHGTSYFEQIAGEVENPTAAGDLFRSPFRFAKHGQSGQWVSNALPHIAQCIDEIAVIKSMYTSNLTHEPALFKMHSGHEVPGYPTLGAWITYGLGSENHNLPAYVVLDDPNGLPINRTQNWQAGFLPPEYQGTRFRSTGSPVLDLKRGYDEPDAVTQLERDLVRELDQMHQRRHPNQMQLGARLASYELAARMQLAATDALDLSQESAATLKMYGIGQEATDSYGRRCLYARRLVERGVRMVQLFIEFQIWDNHTGLASGLKKACDKTDLPIAGLLKDLKQRGLLDQTLVVWGGEFGRLPIAQLGNDKQVTTAGRDHNKNAMVTWMAGAGIRPGISVGQTDDFGFKAVDDRYTVADFHATILHLLGIHHHQLTFRRNGLDERLTGVESPRLINSLLG